MLKIQRNTMVRCGWSVLALGVLMATAGAASASDDEYTSVPMQYGREAEASDELTLITGMLLQPTFTHIDRGAGDNTNQFSFQRLRWFLRGSVTEDVDYLFVTEWARNAATASSDGGARAFRARVTFRDLMDTTNVAIGSIIVPFGHAFYVPAASAPWVNYTRMTSTLYGCGSINCEPDLGEVITNIWKTGAMAFDQVPIGDNASLTYTAGVYNSSGTAGRDDGTQKDFNGSLELNVGDWFLHYGTRIGSQKDPVGVERDRERHAVVVRYNDYLSDPWWLWGEYMWGQDETAGADVTAEGFEVSAGYKFSDRWEGVLRYSQFDPNRDLSDMGFEEYSLGLNYNMGRGIRVQGQFDVERNDLRTVDDNIFTLRVTVPWGAKLI
ncbi:hypothetical protein [Natronospira sp.]|uniref:hypothetical protein n=1 Tax=Natronospira sp. TaxID=2024970 RepID=UPI0038733F98